MESQQTSQPSIRKTCLGIPFASQRALTENERAQLWQDSKQSVRRGLTWGCGAPLVFYLFLNSIVLTLQKFAPSVVKNPVLLMALLLIMVMGIAWFLLRGKRAWNIRKAALQDLEEGQISHYEGLSPTFSSQGMPGAMPPKKGPPKICGIEITPDQPVILEVFSASRRLLSVNGKPVPRFFRLVEEHTATLPPQAETAAKWVEPARIVSDNTLDVSQSGRRQLSDAERDELRERAQTAWRKPALAAFFFTGYLVVLLILDRSTSPLAQPGFVEWFFIAATLWIDFIFVKTLIWTWKLNQDAEKGEVLITREPDKMKGDQMLHRGNVVEWLSISQQGWSINGEPAPWRLRH